MSSKPAHKLRPPPVYDYSSAIARAVEWLGDRYLLAKSIKATPQSPYTRGHRAVLSSGYYELYRRAPPSPSRRAPVALERVRSSYGERERPVFFELPTGHCRKLPGADRFPLSTVNSMRSVLSRRL